MQEFCPMCFMAPMDCTCTIGSDRYVALGLDQPDPTTMCVGLCEGIGIVPVKHDEPPGQLRDLWMESEAQEHSDDGWHFVQCPSCNGTGKAT